MVMATFHPVLGANPDHGAEQWHVEGQEDP